MLNVSFDTHAYSVRLNFGKRRCASLRTNGPEAGPGAAVGLSGFVSGSAEDQRGVGFANAGLRVSFGQSEEFSVEKLLEQADLRGTSYFDNPHTCLLVF